MSLKSIPAALLLTLACSGSADAQAGAWSGDAPGLSDRIVAVKAALTMRSVLRDSAVIDACSLHRVLDVEDPRGLLGPWLGERLRGEASPGCELLLAEPHAYRGMVWRLDRVTRTGGDTVVIRAYVGSSAGRHTEETLLVRTGPDDWLVKEICLSEFLEV